MCIYITSCKCFVTSYARNNRYSSLGFASIGKPLTNNVRTLNKKLKKTEFNNLVELKCKLQNNLHDVKSY